MPCHTRMKIICLQGLLWLYFLEFGRMVMSLEPGFLDFDNLPDTNFSCVGKVIGGYYADLETNCQMFHVCTIGQLDEPMDIRFLCLNGTVFDQETRVCERIDEVDCTKSEQFYSLNLELYGNTQPPVLLEESPETEAPFILKKPSSTTTTTTTTTPSTPSRPKTTQSNYFDAFPQTTLQPPSKEVTSVNLPLGESSDIRFNPLEINVNLKPQAPPIINTQIPRPISFHHQSYTNENPHSKVTATTHTSVYKSNKPHRVPLLPTVTHLTETSSKVEGMQPIQNVHNNQQNVFSLIRHQSSHGPSPTEVNFGFTFHNTEPLFHTTEDPSVNYQFHQSQVDGLRPPPLIHDGHTYVRTKNAHSNGYQGPKSRNRNDFPSPTTASSREKVTPSRKISQHYHSFHTEKPPGLQLPLPALPNLHPLAFSSPAPFSLNPRIENKRYTSNNHAPRIVISARASVSDNSGRRLNYSLGTIGETELVGLPLPNYDEYKDEMEGSFYEDVSKEIKKERHKRSIEDEIDELIRSDDGGVDVLKYLYDWYSKQEETTTIPSLIAEINYKLAPQEPDIAESRGEYSVKTTTKPNSRKASSKGKGKGSRKTKSKLSEAVTEHELGNRFSNAANFDDDHSGEFGSTFGTPFSGYESKHFNFPQESDHIFFDKDGSDSFEVFKDAPDDDFPAANVGDVKEHIEKDDKKGRKYSYKKIVLSQQASKDGNKEEPNGKSIVKNNKVISHETFSEFTNFTDYVDDNDEPRVYQEPLTPTEKETEQPDVYEAPSEKNEKETEKSNTHQQPLTSTEGDVDQGSYTEILKEKPKPTSSTSTVSTVRQRNNRYRNNGRRNNESRRSRYSTTTTSPVRYTTQRYTTRRRSTTRPTTPYYEDEENENASDEVEDESVAPRYATTSYTTEPLPRSTEGSTNNFDHSTTTERPSTTANNYDDTKYETDNYDDVTKMTTEDYAKVTQEYTGRFFYITQNTPYTKEGTSVNPTDIDGITETLSQKQEQDSTSTDYADETTEQNFDNKPVEFNSLRTSTLKTSLPLEDIFSFISTTKSLPYSTTHDMTTGTDSPSTTETTTTEYYDPYTLSLADSPSTLSPENFTETVKSLIHEIEQKTKSVANENDILSITSQTTENIATTTTLIPETTTLPSTSRRTTTRRYSRTRPTSGRNNYRRNFSRHRFAVNTSRSTQAPKVLNEVTKSVKYAVRSSTTKPSYLPAERTTNRYFYSTSDDIYESLEYSTTTETSPEAETSTSYETLSSTTPEITETSTITPEENYLLQRESRFEGIITDEASTSKENTTPDDSFTLSSTTESLDRHTTTTVISTTQTEEQETTTEAATHSGDYYATTLENEEPPSTTFSWVKEELLSTTLLTTEVPSTTTETTTVSTTTASRRRNPSFSTRHRFGFGSKNNSRRRPTSPRAQKYSPTESTTTYTRRRRPGYRDSKFAAATSTVNKVTTERSRRNRTTQTVEDKHLTEPSLSKSVSPTQSKEGTEIRVTTPFSKKKKARLRDEANRAPSFSCFKKDLNKFYSDPRDCRLFHYCTPGYSKGQIVDMKFVCDLGTFFDSEKLVCSKTKPSRCL